MFPLAVLALRTYVLWDCSRWVLCFLMFINLVRFSKHVDIEIAYTLISLCDFRVVC